jgi:DNA polymerase III delta subunit
MSQPAMIEALGVHPYRVKLLVPVARTFTADQIADAFHALRDADRRLKTTDVGPGEEMDLTLHRILRPVSAVPAGSGVDV